MTKNQRALIEAIIDGEYDAVAEELTTALRERRKLIKQQQGAKMRASLNPGDIVRLLPGRPTYLNGLRAEVITVNKSRLKLKMTEEDKYEAGRFGLGTFTTPAHMVELV